MQTTDGTTRTESSPPSEPASGPTASRPERGSASTAASGTSDRLLMNEVYVVTTTDGESFIGAYAGTEKGRHCFATGIFSPLWIPVGKVKEARRFRG
jgi:hypothetical protein